MRDQGCSLETFISKHIASADEWQEWTDVAGAGPPGTRAVMPTSPSDDIWHAKLPPSPEHSRQQELLAIFTNKIRRMLLSGEWEVWARTGAPSTRQRLERGDIEHGVINFSQNSIGVFKSVQILRARPETNREVLQHFIERICSAVEQPGKAITKTVIEDLCARLYPENYHRADFAVAWSEASIHPDWSRPGPRRANSESD